MTENAYFEKNVSEYPEGTGGGTILRPFIMFL